MRVQCRGLHSALTLCESLVCPCALVTSQPAGRTVTLQECSRTPHTRCVNGCLTFNQILIWNTKTRFLIYQLDHNVLLRALKSGLLSGRQHCNCLGIRSHKVVPHARRHSGRRISDPEISDPDSLVPCSATRHLRLCRAPREARAQLSWGCGKYSGCGIGHVVLSLPFWDGQTVVKHDLTTADSVARPS